MSKIEIIPAIDIIDGKCVRLSRGDYSSKKIYDDNPLEVAKRFEANGIKRLHLVDLDGAKAKKIINYKTLNTIANNTNLIIDFGGGIKSEDDLKIAFENGAKMITGGTIAVKEKELFSSWIKKYGSEKIILGADAKNKKIAVSGWIEESNEDIFSFINEYREKGINKIISTDIDKDGMLKGVSIELYREIMERFREIYLIASGGVSQISDIDELIKINVPAVIVGKAIYENRITLEELKEYV